MASLTVLLFGGGHPAAGKFTLSLGSEFGNTGGVKAESGLGALSEAYEVQRPLFPFPQRELAATPRTPAEQSVWETRASGAQVSSSGAVTLSLQ